MKKHFLFLMILFSSFLFAQNTNIFDIARKGTLEELKVFLIKNPAAINEINTMSFSPLILACYRGNEEVANYLMDVVENVNYVSSEGTALSALCMHYNKILVQKILDKGADVNFVDAHDSTPLLYAVQKQNIDLAKILLAYGAKTTFKDKSGVSIFEHALKTNNQELINLLKN